MNYSLAKGVNVKGSRSKVTSAVTDCHKNGENINLDEDVGSATYKTKLVSRGVIHALEELANITTDIDEVLLFSILIKTTNSCWTVCYSLYRLSFPTDQL